VEQLDLAAGRLLIALPTLHDPNFRRSVILLCEHNDEGSLGIIVNRPTPVKLASGLGVPLAEAREGDLLFQGGPVSPSHLFTFHNVPDLREESRPIVPGVWFAPCSERVADRLRLPPQAGEFLRLYTGYAGWSPGQLADELEQTAWIVGPASAELVYAHTPKSVWGLALQAIGGPAAFLATAPEDPRLN
jgi:putative transcriptional regulator